MTAITFDTLKFVETLKASGFDEPQARGMAAAIQDVQNSNLDEVATRQDLEMVKIELKRDIKELELRISAEIAPLKWGMAVCVGGVIALILKSFFPH
ncbi:coiled-coil domain-containing protein [Candidatus Magnetaquicoccus inordinatus]|uniref:coiled-coil domain-containing protein n=1 Tax=Candidatus Magnetaquicoccus inordinatus TaxID=2496818 RepID=UPI00102CEE09|nr:coiled-coil domain-containing protein [Candidatus Magnetaquicoccus inordinatus]